MITRGTPVSSPARAKRAPSPCPAELMRTSSVTEAARLPCSLSSCNARERYSSSPPAHTMRLTAPHDSCHAARRSSSSGSSGPSPRQQRMFPAKLPRGRMRSGEQAYITPGVASGASARNDAENTNSLRRWGASQVTPSPSCSTNWDIRIHFTSFVRKSKFKANIASKIKPINMVLSSQSWNHVFNTRQLTAVCQKPAKPASRQLFGFQNRSNHYGNELVRKG